jgi:TPR repeat protein
MKKYVPNEWSDDLPRRWLEEACELFEAGERIRSVALFTKAAEAGIPEAQVNLANLYDEGDGVETDFGKARYWYKRAIRLGLPEGSYNLGVAYLNRGDHRWARHWLEVAKSLGADGVDEPLARITSSAR